MGLGIVPLWRLSRIEKVVITHPKLPFRNIRKGEWGSIEVTPVARADVVGDRRFVQSVPV